MRHKLDRTRSASGATGQVYAYIHNDDAEEMCPIPTTTQGEILGIVLKVLDQILDLICDVTFLFFMKGHH